MDLLSPRPFWPIRDGLPADFPPLTRSTECEVAIIGGGICGAFVAALLTEAGHDVLVLERREVAHGSTAGNTGLMMYELDVMLHRLIALCGQSTAERAYRRCCAAVQGLERVVEASKLDCGFERKSSLFLAANSSHLARLRREFAARRAAGLDVAWWSRSRLRQESALPQPAGMLSAGAAQLDAYRLTYGLLMSAQRAGAKVHDRTTVARWKFRRSGVDLFTARSHRVRARHIVVATGYEAETFLPKKVAALHSTFALVTDPIVDGQFIGWPAGRPLIWDTANPYLYMRTTADDRVLIGGYDERFYGPRARDRLLSAKAGALRRRLGQLFPRLEFEVATAWAGTFAITADGMPYIGQHPEVPHTWFALGFGGNGTTFSLIAAEIIRAALAGETDPDASLFRFNR